MSAFYAQLLAVIAHRSLSLRAFLEVVIATVRTTAVVTIVLCGAFLFNSVMTVKRIPQACSPSSTRSRSTPSCSVP